MEQDNFDNWWKEHGEKMCGKKNRHPCALAYAEGAFNALMKSFKQWADEQENE